VASRQRGRRQEEDARHWELAQAGGELEVWGASVVGVGTEL